MTSGLTVAKAIEGRDALAVMPEVTGGRHFGHGCQKALVGGTVASLWPKMLFGGKKLATLTSRSWRRNFGITATGGKHFGHCGFTVSKVVFGEEAFLPP